MSLASVVFDPYKPDKLQCGAFKRFQVVTHPLGGTLIAWELKDSFYINGPLHFFVDFGRSGTDKWETLNQSPIIDNCVYMDWKQRHWDHLVAHYYRIRMVAPNEIDPSTGACRVEVSQPWIGNGVWTKRDWLVAREVMRKEYLLQRKRTNLSATGMLLKRKRFGTKCPDCIDPNTDEVLNGSCETCFGTKFIGGYFPGIYYTLTANAPWSREFKRDGQISLRNDIVRQCRGASYPYIDTNDVYLRRDSGERFYINSISTLAEVGGIPIVLSIELRLAPDTDIIYKIPIAGPYSSSSSSSADACGPDAGKDRQPQW